MKRSSGIICHITSLPGEYGIGTLGKQAFEFVDFLLQTGQKLWQILPLGPTGYGDSPYQCFSAYAGNPLLISLEQLRKDAWLSIAELDTSTEFNNEKVDFGKLIKHKIPLLKKAFERFETSVESIDKVKFQDFCLRNEKWLNDFALFMALKSHFGGVAWVNWDSDIRLRKENALTQYTNELKDEINFHKFIQYIFFKQWLELKSYANNNGIKIIGDIPIYISSDSADAWTHSDLFMFDKERQPIEVAGVPPDYFSETGQLWGNPIFNWKKLKETNFAWWIERIKANQTLFDIIRIDHFRGFEAYWSIPFGEETAINGHWVKAPGKELYETIKKELGDIEIIAEDLGVITPEVEDLRDQFNLPGMKILQFANYSNGNDEYLPHNYPKNCVVYTGTHDNDTTISWYKNLDESEKEKVNNYLLSDGNKMNWSLLRAAWSSVADIAIAPLQDILGLDSEGRMNTPGVAAGNWNWRFLDGDLKKIINEDKLKKLTELFGR